MKVAEMTYFKFRPTSFSQNLSLTVYVVYVLSDPVFQCFYLYCYIIDMYFIILFCVNLLEEHIGHVGKMSVSGCSDRQFKPRLDQLIRIVSVDSAVK